MEWKTHTRPHEKLDVWNLALELAEQMYRLTDDFPDSELYGLTAQLRRGSCGVPSHIAEGMARGTAPDRKRFLYIARGALSEIETQLEISRRIDLLETDELVEPGKLLDDIGWKLNRLIERQK